MLEATFDLLVPLVMAAIINTGIANKDKGYILSHCGLLILLGVIGLTCSITAQYFAAKAAGELTVEVTVDGETIERCALSAYTGGTYESRGYTLTVAAENGAVRVSESDCPNQDCVHSGAISRAGQSVVCLPARIAVTLEGAAADYDLIAG